MQKSTSSKQKAAVKKDHYAQYVIGFSILLAALSFFYFNQTKADTRAEFNIGYSVMKSTVFEEDGVVAQMTAAVQVHEDDLSWLKKNEKEIYEVYAKEMRAIDLDSLQTKAGMLEGQKELARRLNLVFKTNKIEAVLLTDLVLQHDY